MRSGNQASVDSVVETVQAGSSAAMVVRGESAMEWPAGFRVTSTSGAKSDVDLPGAGVHQLCAQLLDQVELLSPSQREVLRSAFDPTASRPDPSSVGLTVFSLLAGAADSGPVVCLVRQPEWLDEFSRQALAFTARRLMTESVALLFLVHGSAVPQELAGLPELGARQDLDVDVDAVTAG